MFPAINFYKASDMPKTPIYTTIFAIFLFITACNQDGHTPAGEGTGISSIPANDTVVVETALVKQGTFTIENWCNGTLQAGQKAIIPFEVQGNLISVNVRNGQWVSAGQLLAQIDDYRQKQAYEQALINHRQAEIEYNDQLLLSGYSSTDTSAAPAKVKSVARLRSGLQQANLELEKARRELSNTRLSAPVSGMVAGLTARAYTPSSEYKNLCTLLNTREMLAVFEVLEHDAAAVKQGAAVEVIPVAMPGTRFSGRVTGADPMLSSNGTISVTAAVPNSDGRLIDGMKVKVVLKTAIPDQIIVPKPAVLARQNRQIVFTVEDGLAIWNYVTTGYENSTHYTITEGLEPGQEIIISNNLTIGHQAPVIVSNPKH